MEEKQIEMLQKMRGAFPKNQINKLPKGSKAQMKCPAEEKRNCSICGGWHHPKLKHLDYVGHAALTDRLLDVDPLWFWEPLAFTEQGLPAFDEKGGLWIKLTICGHTRIGYGNAEPSQYKEVGSREKEVIGDALRNTAMRFGGALELWHKGDLHVDQPEQDEPPNDKNKGTIKDQEMADIHSDLVAEVDKLASIDELNDWQDKNKEKVVKCLSGVWLTKFNSYFSQLKDVFEPK